MRLFSSSTFTYNGLGQRAGKVDGTGTFSFTRTSDAIDGNVLSDGAAKYASGAAGLISENRGGTSKFYHADGLGSTRAITNASGTTTDTKTTDAFGLTYASTGSTPSPFGFAGKHGYQSDNDTGLMLLGHRYYDSSTGRFLSRDPIQDGTNWYAYCGNDPVNAVDPEGLFSWAGIKKFFERIFHGGPPKPPVGQPLPPGHGPGWEYGHWSTREGSGPRWRDPDGGEWRYHDVDNHHPDAHWDYNPWDRWNSAWKNIALALNPTPVGAAIEAGEAGAEKAQEFTDEVRPGYQWRKYGRWGGGDLIRN